MHLNAFRRRLLTWFRKNHRDLPWRRTTDPYRIWISEVMLQQTRVAAVVPYYRRFLRRFPTVRALARAREEELLKYWAGLGYYSRARNLHCAAKEIVARHSGKFPRDWDAAIGLPGVGRYTAAAVLSIAYGAPLAVLDGNVARVLARLDALRGDVRAPRQWRKLEQRAGELLEVRAAGEWNQAMMELGATVCTPRAPSCEECPVSRQCRAYHLGIARSLPAKRKKRATVPVEIAAAVLLDPAQRTLLVRRADGEAASKLFSRMWHFPAVEVKRHAESELRQHLVKSLNIIASDVVQLPPARHTVTYRNVTLLPFLVPVRQDFQRVPSCRSTTVSLESQVALTASKPNCSRLTIPLEQVDSLPTSSATRKIARAAQGA